MLYPKSKNDRLNRELFKNPTSEYRAAPFWAWNCKLDKDQLLRQIEQLKEMGMGGYHIHARNGLATEYMGNEFMELISECNEKGKSEGMLTWLYDEDRYPSGSAGGKVTKGREYSERYILFTPYAYGKAPEGEDLTLLFSLPRQEEGMLLARYIIELDEDGYLKSYKRLLDDEHPNGTIWYAYLEIAPASSWFNNETYVDTMNKQAIEKFVELTYNRYYKEVGKDFGISIPAIFTDEPQMIGKGRLDFSKAKKDVTIPYTNDFSGTFKKQYGYNPLDRLPEFFWELSYEELSPFRYHYNMHTSDRFYDAFFKTVGTWCDNHNLLFTGHLMSEQSLLGQYLRLGEAMRHYDAFGIPGIDMLSDNHEFTTAKQAQSVVHQNGSQGMLSELDGVTNWDYDFRGHKLQGDWQAALGVTVRVPHLTWVSMEGEAKRDYPASIGYHSPWYKEYSIVENHFARVATALTRGSTDVKVAVIHPIESYWLLSGPHDKTSDICKELDDNFHNLCKWLVEGQIDFDYISESLLPEKCKEGSVPLKVGKMKYEAIVVADLRTIRLTTLERLEAFADAGGMLIFTGAVPKYVDAVLSNRAIKLAQRAGIILFSKTALLNSLDVTRVIDIRSGRGNRTDNMMYQLRSEGDDKWLFICHMRNPKNPDITSEEKLTITINGIWSIEIYDTITGEVYPIECIHRLDKTIINRCIYAHDSLLMKLTYNPDILAPQIEKNTEQSLADIDIPKAVTIKLSEPNVLLLDIAEYAFDDGPWQKFEEILKIDSKFREKLGYEQRGRRLVQPYILPERSKEMRFLRLRFNIKSEIDIKEPQLAIEHPELAELKLNGRPVKKNIVGWFVDEAIKKVKLPPIYKGENELEIKMQISERIGAEWCYLLGDFGVRVAGSRSMLIEPVKELSFSDWTHQGLPFYAGNVTYCLEVISKEEVEIEVSHFRNPVIRVDMDGEKKGLIAFAPYKLTIPTKPGRHTVEIVAYGNRHNAFGCIHNSDVGEFYFDPGTWRTTGLSWSYEYRLKEIGILKSPIVRV